MSVLWAVPDMFTVVWGCHPDTNAQELVAVYRQAKKSAGKGISGGALRASYPYCGSSGGVLRDLLTGA